jgi:Cft2 family RNA processing exonuclease
MNKKIQMMALGGADEIGASCYLLKFNSLGIMLDCGIRMKLHNTIKDVEPDFVKIHEFIDQPAKLKAIIISHAHMDHIGAIPYMFENFPQIPIYTPKGTLDLIKLQLKTSNQKQKAMDYDYQFKEYNDVLLENLFSNIQEVPFESIKKIPGTNIYFEFFHAGHILGSASIYLKWLSDTILFTGDICGYPRESVAQLNYKKSAEIIISESTYLREELRNSAVQHDVIYSELFKAIEEIMNKNGNVLIPCFALGKAQELIIALIQHLKNHPNAFRIILDGYIKPITDIYLNNELFSSSYVSDFVEQYNEIKDLRLYKDFFSHNRNLVILASSGMLLKDSASAYWASCALPDPNSAIFFSGYLDEESPGFQILSQKLKDQKLVSEESKISEIKCKIAKYYVPTHTSVDQWIEIMDGLHPKKIFLVHGSISLLQQQQLNIALENRMLQPVELISTKNLQKYLLKEEKNDE